MKRLRIYLLGIISAFCCLGAGAQALTFESEGYTYRTYPDRKGEVEIIAAGSEITGYIYLPDSVSYGGRKYSVTGIGSGTFKDREDITDIYVGQEMMRIEDNVFNNCTSLKSIYLKSVRSIGRSAFEGCTSLKDIDLCEVEEIEADAFRGCSGITGIDFKNVKKIGSSAFESCTSLKSIDFSNVYEIGFSSFSNCTGLDSLDIKNITIIPESAFKGCGITTANIRNATSIASSAFNTCPSMKDLTFTTPLPPQAPDDAFDWEALSSITLHVPAGSIAGYKDNSVWGLFKNIEEYKPYDFEYKGLLYCIDNRYGGSAFVVGPADRSIRNAIVPRIASFGEEQYSVLGIERGAFAGCTSLSYVDAAMVNEIGSSAFAGCTSLDEADISMTAIIGNDAFRGCTSLREMAFNDVQSIGDNAFTGCTALVSIKLYETSVIGDYAFSGCTSLAEADLKEVKRIGFKAFDKCSALKTVIMHKVSEAGALSFSNCTSLTSVDLGILTRISKQMFRNCNSLPSIDMKAVTSVGPDAFALCKNITEIDTKEIEYLGQNAFSDCEKINKIDMRKVNMLGRDALKGCTALSDLHVYTKMPPVTEETSHFADTAIYNAALYIPGGSRKAYENDSVWNRFKTISEFYINPVTLSISCGEGGAVIFDDKKITSSESFTIEKGDSILFSLEIDDRYILKSIVANDSDITSTVKNDSCSILISENTTVAVTFEAKDPASIDTVSSSDVKVSAASGLITVEGVGSGVPIMVYTAAGTLTASQISDGSRMVLMVPSGQVYIVTAGARTFKIIM